MRWQDYFVIRRYSDVMRVPRPAGSIDYWLVCYHLGHPHPGNMDLGYYRYDQAVQAALGFLREIEDRFDKILLEDG